MSKKLNFFPVNENRTIYEFQNRKFEKLETLGEGSFGKVLLVKEINPKNSLDSKKYAIKTNKRLIHKSDDPNNLKIENPMEINHLELRELTNMRKNNHPNLINLEDFHISEVDNEIWKLMEYIHLNLGTFFKKNKNNKKVMNEKFFKKISYQILDGINYLHKNRIMHRDLKLDNILYDDKKNIIKIIDFGLSRQFDYDINSEYTIVGTRPYRPPEVPLGSKHYDNSFDIWSIGCILVEICTQLYLFAAKDSLSVLKKINQIFGSFNSIPEFKDLPKYLKYKNVFQEFGFGLINYIKKNQKFVFENNNFYDLIERILCIDPSKRINAKDALNHPWFSNMD